MRVLTVEQFVEEFQPVSNPTDHSSFYIDTEWYDVLRHCGYKHVWTLVEGDDGKSYIVPGMRYVNRLAYVLTNEYWVNKNIEVHIDEFVYHI